MTRYYQTGISHCTMKLDDAKNNVCLNNWDTLPSQDRNQGDKTKIKSL